MSLLATGTSLNGAGTHDNAADEWARSVKRRALLVAAAGGLVARIATAEAARESLQDLQVEDEHNLHRIYRRMRFAADDQVVFWWMKGRRFGIVDNELQPFFNMEVGSMHRCRERDDGGYEVATAAAIYYTDLQSEELLQSWRNPVTGELVRFDYNVPAATAAHYSYLSGRLDEPSAMGMRVERRTTFDPVRVDSAEVWLTEENYVRLFREASAAADPAMRVHDLYTYSCQHSALRDSQLAYVHAAVQFNDYNDWSPRFQMGEHRGTSVSRCAGRKESRLEQLPGSYLKLARRLHPQAFADPIKTLAQAWAG